MLMAEFTRESGTMDAETRVAVEVMVMVRF